jgi:hypothetical protein
VRSVPTERAGSEVRPQERRTGRDHRVVRWTINATTALVFVSVAVAAAMATTNAVRAWAPGVRGPGWWASGMVLGALVLIVLLPWLGGRLDDHRRLWHVIRYSIAWLFALLFLPFVIARLNASRLGMFWTLLALPVIVGFAVVIRFHQAVPLADQVRLEMAEYLNEFTFEAARSPDDVARFERWGSMLQPVRRVDPYLVSSLSAMRQLAQLDLASIDMILEDGSNDFGQSLDEWLLQMLRARLYLRRFAFSGDLSDVLAANAIVTEGSVLSQIEPKRFLRVRAHAVLEELRANTLAATYHLMAVYYDDYRRRVDDPESRDFLLQQAEEIWKQALAKTSSTAVSRVRAANNLAESVMERRWDLLRGMHWPAYGEARRPTDSDTRVLIAAIDEVRHVRRLLDRQLSSISSPLLFLTHAKADLVQAQLVSLHLHRVITSRPSLEHELRQEIRSLLAEAVTDIEQALRTGLDLASLHKSGEIHDLGLCVLLAHDDQQGHYPPYIEDEYEGAALAAALTLERREVAFDCKLCHEVGARGA